MGKGCKMPDTCVPGKFCPAECAVENGMRTGLNKCLVIIASQTKMEIAGIHAQWIVVKIQFSQEVWTQRAVQCLILACQLETNAQKCKEDFQNWIVKDLLLLFMLRNAIHL